MTRFDGVVQFSSGTDPEKLADTLRGYEGVQEATLNYSARGGDRATSIYVRGEVDLISLRGIRERVEKTAGVAYFRFGL